jgi:hypothetical protein
VLFELQIFEPLGKQMFKYSVIEAVLLSKAFGVHSGDLTEESCVQNALLFAMLVGNRDSQLVIVTVITNKSGKGWKQLQVLFEIMLEYFMQLARFGRLFPAAGRHIYPRSDRTTEN